MAKTSDFDFFDKIYDEYYKKIYNYAYARLLNRSYAEDATAEIFMVVLEHISDFDVNRGNFSTWLFTIARNKITDYNKKAYLNREVSVETPPEVAAPDNELEAFENLTNYRAQKLLEKLSPEERDFLALRYELDLSNAEIAAIYNLTPNAVSNRYHRLLEKCRRIMV